MLAPKLKLNKTKSFVKRRTKKKESIQLYRKENLTIINCQSS